MTTRSNTSTEKPDNAIMREYGAGEYRNAYRLLLAMQRRGIDHLRETCELSTAEQHELAVKRAVLDALISTPDTDPQTMADKVAALWRGMDTTAPETLRLMEFADRLRILSALKDCDEFII